MNSGKKRFCQFSLGWNGLTMLVGNLRASSFLDSPKITTAQGKNSVQKLG
jgi:hypothetical protein